MQKKVTLRGTSDSMRNTSECIFTITYFNHLKIPTTPNQSTLSLRKNQILFLFFYRIKNDNMNHHPHNRVKDPIIPQHLANKQNRRPSMVDDGTQKSWSQKQQCHHQKVQQQQQHQHPHAGHPSFDDTFGHIHWGNPGTERIATPQALEYISIVHRHDHNNNNNDIVMNTSRSHDRY